MAAIARNWATQGFDLLWPPRCLLCGGEPPAGDDAAVGHQRRIGVCAACVRTLGESGDRCGRCGQPGGDDPCGRCAGRLGGCAGIVVLGGYADGLRDAVLKAKRPRGDLLSAALAALLVERHAAQIHRWRIDVVVPVPMHWLRRLGRGTSAADELARGVARGLGLPQRRALIRARRTVMQNELPRGERRANVARAFRAVRRVAGRRVLLVDDVTTTGATLAACSAALLSAGAGSVYAAVAARADTADD